MRPDWFHDSIPLDPLIAPLVLFFRNNRINTVQSCQGKMISSPSSDHLYGCPTISFEADSLNYISWVSSLLARNNLDNSLEVGLNTGFFSHKIGSMSGWYGRAQWIWTETYKEAVYDRVIKLVDMSSIESIVGDIDEWMKNSRPVLR